MSWDFTVDQNGAVLESTAPNPPYHSAADAARAALSARASGTARLEPVRPVPPRATLGTADGEKAVELARAFRTAPCRKTVWGGVTVAWELVRVPPDVTDHPVLGTLAPGFWAVWQLDDEVSGAPYCSAYVLAHEDCAMLLPHASKGLRRLLRRVMRRSRKESTR